MRKKQTTKNTRKLPTRRKNLRRRAPSDLKDFAQFPEAATAELSPKSLAAVYTTSTVLHKALKRLADK